MSTLLLTPASTLPITGRGTYDDPFVVTGQYESVKLHGPVHARLENVSVTGPDTAGVSIRDGARVTFAGTVEVAGWSTYGVDVTWGSSLLFDPSTTLTITGSLAGYGMHIFAHSKAITYSADVAIKIRNCRYSFQLGLSALFQHRGVNGLVECRNDSRPNESAAVQGTDHSSWSTTNQFVADMFTRAIDLNSISYAEATGQRTFTNLTQVYRTVQSSNVWLP